MSIDYQAAYHEQVLETDRLRKWLEAIENVCIDYIFDGEPKDLGVAIQSMTEKARAGAEPPVDHD